MVWGLVAGGIVVGAVLSGGQLPEAAVDPTSADEWVEAEGSAEDGRGGAGAAERERRRFDAIGVPLISYNSDLGWGIGLVGGAYLYAPGYEPYRHAVAAQAFVTTEGVRNHWLRYDGPSLFGNARLEIRGEYRRELYAPFYGPGNLSGPGADIRRHVQLWSFDYFAPGGWARLRTKPVDAEHPLEVYAGYGFHHVRVRPRDASALAEVSPRGIEGGAHGKVLLGILWDTRDHETDPTSGGMEEIAARLSAAPTASRYQYVSLTLVIRRYWALGSPRMILAQRLIADLLSSGAPFFEWSQLGGTAGGEGVGGMSSVRGVPRNRYQGTAKLISNTELRFYVWDFPLFGEVVKTGGVAYLDLGRVWHPAVDDGSILAWHPGVGTGVRVARRAAVVRFDVALSAETGRPGIYIAFGHMF